MSHTPGPWHVTKDGRSEEIVRAADASGKPIASMWMNGDSMEANARLIAAAPEMLAVLEAVDHTLAGSSVSRATVAKRWRNADGITMASTSDGSTRTIQLWMQRIGNPSRSLPLHDPREQDKRQCIDGPQVLPLLRRVHALRPNRKNLLG